MMPDTVPLKRRDIRFHMDTPVARFWLNGDCHRTRFYDAMSIMFPEGERAFIETVRLHRDNLHGNPALERDAAEFIAQEALHSREHVRYNERLRAQGMPVADLEQRVAAQQQFARRYLSPAMRLALTICLEHFTAMFADRLLREPRTLAGADARMRDLWQWHALEEIEHKGVAFDVFTASVSGAVRRYVLRCGAMLVVTLVFSSLLWRTTFALVRHDGQASHARGWLRLLREQFISPGTLTRMVPRWLAWFSPRFHPWRDDNRALTARFAARFDALSQTHATAESHQSGNAARR